MPTYDYQCPVCEHIVERSVLSGTDPNHHVVWCSACENAGTQNYPILMRRLPTAPNFTIKGYSAKNGYSK